MKKSTCLSLVAAITLIAGTTTANAAQTVTSSLTAQPAVFNGACPAHITFNGQITATQAGQVQYKFIRSDGGNAPVQTINFTGPGTKPVSSSWTIGGAALPNYAGWQAIQIVYPQPSQSNKAEFKINCAINKITASLKSNPVAIEGSCPAKITFNGQITATQAGPVQYKFIRSDGATAPVQTLNFPAAGTLPVTTTWTLGGAALPNFNGWQAIQIIAPQQLQSNKADFSVKCLGNNIHANLSADPVSINGKCPAKITFNGQISATQAGPVQYKFIRSDNAISPVQTLNFTGPGSMPVSTTWTLGGATLPNFNGWQAIQIIAPKQLQSEKAAFSVKCSE